MVEEYHLKSWIEVAEKLSQGYTTVILPVGTVEAHGTHLPLSTDTIVPIEIARRLSEYVKALVAPPIYYGVTQTLSCYPGSIPVTKASFTSYLYDIFVGFAKSGFLNIIVINGHAGNIECIKDAAERAYASSRIRVLCIDWWILCDDIVRKYYGVSSGHGAVEETSAILAVDESLVKRKLYDSRQEILKRNGVWMFPSVGSVIKREENDVPDFDAGKARKFFNEVCTFIEGIVREFMEKASINPL